MEQPRGAWSSGYPAYPNEGDEPEPTAPGRPRRGRLLLTATAVAAVIGLLAGATGYVISRSADAPRPSVQVSIAPVPSDGGGVSSGGTVATIVAAAMPTVVSIAVGPADAALDSGSGFVLREDGYLLTNNHVVASAGLDGITVVFEDGTSVPAQIVGRNISYDIAVLKVERTGLPTAEIGDSDSLRVGDTVLAIGTPLGLTGTVTAGIVSALDRPVVVDQAAGTAYIDAIQTDAAINPGNSGGPLIDGTGRVVGITSANATLAAGSDGGSIGLGFAIPMSSAARIADEIIATGASTTPVIGVTVDTSYAGPGALLMGVAPGGPGEAAGLQVGDLITRFDGRLVASGPDLVVMIRRHAPGDTVSLEYQRADMRIQTSIILGSSTTSAR